MFDIVFCVFPAYEFGRFSFGWVKWLGEPAKFFNCMSEVVGGDDFVMRVDLLGLREIAKLREE